MSKIEELYLMCTADETDSKELSQLYRKISDELDELIGREITCKIDLMYMNCIYIEKIEAFKSGFRRATALWKEC